MDNYQNKKEEVLQQAVALLLAHADEDFVSKKDALAAGTNLHNLMIEMRAPAQDNPKLERSPDKIIEYVNHYYPIFSDEGRMKVCIDVVRREQAARIDELENDLNESNDMYDKDIKLLRGKISELEAERDRYREALEVEKSAEGILMANSFEIYQDNDDLCLKFTMEGAVKAIEDYSNQKVNKLEAKNNKFKEALRDIIGSYKGHNFKDIIEISEQALNSKEAGQ